MFRRSTTSGFYFGKAEAEAENDSGKEGFMNYFEDYLGILPRIEAGGFIVTGRKGAGKSAVAKYLDEHKPHGLQSFSKIIRIAEVQAERLLQSKALADQAEPYTAIFEWLILVQLAKLLVKNKSAAYTKEYEKLNVFLDRNRGITLIDKYSIDEIVKNENLEVGIEPLKHAFHALLARHLNVRLSHAPFYKLIEPLREIVQQLLSYDVNRDCKYTLLFDDLDIFLTRENKENALRHLMSLIRVAKAYNTDFLKPSRNARIIILLRDDFKADLASNADAAKVFMSYEVALNWYDPEAFRADVEQPLKKFINRRVEANFLARNLDYNYEDPWTTLFAQDVGSHKGGSFKYALDHTFYRPRDLVNMLSVLGSHDYKYPLDVPSFSRLMKRYGLTVIAELKSELSYVLSDQKVGYIFDNLMPWMTTETGGNHSMSTEKVAKKMRADKIVKDDDEFNELVSVLYRYSLIGFHIAGTYFFNYREFQPTKYFWDNNSGMVIPRAMYVCFTAR